jgi:hypothetical protein
MPADGTPIDRAFARCHLLALIIQSEYVRATANPTNSRYDESGFGVTKVGDTREVALPKIRQAFDDLVALVEHVTILDMAAALEELFKSRIATAIGAGRKTLREQHRGDALAARAGLVHDVDDFQGLAEIAKLIAADLSPETQGLLNKVREDRNRFAHGTDLRLLPSVQKDEARAALNEAVDLLRPA